MSVSSWLNFGRPAPPERGSAAGRNFLAPPYYSQRAVFAFPPSDFFSFTCFVGIGHIFCVGGRMLTTIKSKRLPKENINMLVQTNVS